MMVNFLKKKISLQYNKIIELKKSIHFQEIGSVKI